MVLHEAQQRLSRLEVVWVDQGYSGQNFQRATQQVCGKRVCVELIQRTSTAFEVLPQPWIVERSFGWFNPTVVLHELASREGKFEVVQPSNEMAAPANTSAAVAVAFRKDLKIVRQRITSSQTTGRGASSRW